MNIICINDEKGIRKPTFKFDLLVGWIVILNMYDGILFIHLL